MTNLTTHEVIMSGLGTYVLLITPKGSRPLQGNWDPVDSGGFR